MAACYKIVLYAFVSFFKNLFLKSVLCISISLFSNLNNTLGHDLNLTIVLAKRGQICKKKDICRTESFAPN